MPITLLDFILIGVMLVSAVLAMVRGFMREVLSIAAWIIDNNNLNKHAASGGKSCRGNCSTWVTASSARASIAA